MAHILLQKEIKTDILNRGAKESMASLTIMGQNALRAKRKLASAATADKNAALLKMAEMLERNVTEILAANEIDVENGISVGMKESLLDRLRLTEERVTAMANGIREIAALPDPCGEIISGGTGYMGLDIKCVRVPLGVCGIIYEARPNVTSDAAALCFKAGNACILRGGSDAINSNKAIANLLRCALDEAGFDEDCIALVEDTSHETAIELMRLTDYLDVLIPRGGAGLIRSVVENSTVPVIETGVGNCHIYVDESADINMAANIIGNAKTSRPSVCNAAETLLVHKNIAHRVLPAIAARLDKKSVEIRGCEITRSILGDRAVPVQRTDYETEFLDYILACRVVDSLDEAIDHIAEYSSGHSEAIITNDYSAARRFTAEVDSAAVYVNASTRFTDGGIFGFGAEIGISTQKLHARGPMGLKHLTSQKYIILGNGQIRE